MVKTVCINDKNMPPDFRNRQLWPKKGNQYHIERILFIERSRCLGVQLSEIDLSNNYPYEFFRIERFGFNVEDLEDLENLIKACKEEQDSDFSKNFDVEKFVQEEILVNEEE